MPSGALYAFSGTGLYPNSKPTAKAEFTGGTSGAAVIESLSNSAPDGSFPLIVVPEDGSVSYKEGATLAVTVTDAYGDWASGQCVNLPDWPKGWIPKSGTSSKTW